jgi:type I restriction-modification system, S subunit|nr:restriction endonuclease subunit S [uncultured Campylobacter sp.]
MKSEFKNLPSGWRVVKLEKVAPLQRGYDLPTDNIKEGLYPVVYSNGILRFHNEFKAKAPGVITGRSGTIGKVVYVEEDYWPHNTSLWVTNFYDNNPKFIYYMYINLNLARFSAGSGVPTLNRNDIHAQTIPLPPLDEQEKIAEILSTWDEAINLTINLIENKKRFKKALMQILLTAKIRFPEFKDEWKETKLGKCLKEKSDRNTKNIDLVLSVTNKFGFVTQVEYFDKSVASDNMTNYKIVKKGNFAYNPSRINIGSIALLESYEIGILSPMYVVFECLKNSDNRFLKFWFQSHNFIGNLYKYLAGSVRKSLNFKDMKTISIKLPNLNEQQKIAEVLAACDDEINLLNLKLENLKKQKQDLMQKLLSGKVRVRI